ncbi:arginine--tRNA ligase [Gynurincola endophyticus]|uniref:arginine--tRNA ligase n=1 Tax=Gynurincola endophyticus TaxID=2479004 RepID=UPI000F8ECF2A|nr:arginine--tRNA ligase [Gynurincola endophyticus]
MSIVSIIQKEVAQAISANFQLSVAEKDILINETKPEFEGDYTVVLFSLVKSLKKAPEQIGNELGNALLAQCSGLIARFNVIKGFLNISLQDSFWIQFLGSRYTDKTFGNHSSNGQKVMVEYSSPNTNKPLHLGHLRNNFLGWSIAEIFKAYGYDVVKTCIVNDRGVHICKSMLAWQKFGNGATPASTGIKGDHLVGDFYVKFENELKAQTVPVLEEIKSGNFENIQAADTPKLQQFLDKLPTLEGEKKESLEDEIKEIARNNTPIMREVRAMLLKWEEGDQEVLKLWSTMNQWVYDGFNETYKVIGSDFDKTYYESQTYLLGKDLVEQGLEKGVFYQKEDGSVWIDLTADGLDEKIVRRRDGTSVYITQDIGLALQKYEEFKCDKSIYVVGDEQNYHFKVLKLIAQKLGLPAADGIFHLSYGMVELPFGKMKSREGTVVDADDLAADMVKIAEEKTTELGKVNDFTQEQLQHLYRTIGLGGLKFFLLRVDAKKRIIFNPEESIDIHGFTAAFVQYAYARIQSILRKEGTVDVTTSSFGTGLLPLEKAVISLAEQFPAVVAQAAQEYNPSVIAAYVFKLAQSFNSFYSEHSIGKAENEEKKVLRIAIAMLTANIIERGMHLMGINVPSKM